MKKGKIGIICVAIASFFMTACGSTVPEMTEEQNAQVVEYAAGLLLKYDENYHSRLVEETEEPVKETEAETLEKESEQEEETTASLQEEPEKETEVIDRTQEAQGSAARSIEEFYGIDGVTIAYAGYEVKDTYPDASADSDELILAMGATSGCKLLVLNFEVNNISGSDVNLDMLSLNTRFKISINGETPRYVLTTMLMDDLSSYVGTIAAGTSQRLVLVCEIPTEKANTIQTLSLNMKNVSEDGTISLN